MALLGFLQGLMKPKAANAVQPAGREPEVYVEVRNYMDRALWDQARFALQKISYTMVGAGVTAEEKARFTEFMTEFARRDPLFIEALPLIRREVSARPGMMQSDLTGLLKHDPAKVEGLRYVLYFAEQTGDLIRVKKGRSYELYLPT
jgi:hypothetical protein